jgi:receptor expression-enhancing protein 5/6
MAKGNRTRNGPAAAAEDGEGAAVNGVQGVVQKYLDLAKEKLMEPVVEDPNVDKALKGFVAIATLWLMFGYGAQFLCNFIGFVYPAYRSVKALESGQKQDDTQWLMYWVVFALFSVVEFFSDIIVGWVPFYWLGKCAFLLWCMSPLEGSSTIYERIIRPYFLKHEMSIDNVVKQGTDKVSKFADAAVEKAKDFAAEQQLNKND